VSNLDIAESHFATWVRYNKSFETYRAMKLPPRNLKDGELKVIVITGATGLGKTHLVNDLYPNAYWQVAARDRKGTPFYDQYSGQDTIILDEFYGWLPFDHLLRLCDRYPLRLEVKGSVVQCQAKTIVLTSNHDPRRWYPNVGSHYEAFERRVTDWIHFDAFKCYCHINQPTDNWRQRADRFYAKSFPGLAFSDVSPNFIE